jgi:hypothetical protein
MARILAYASPGLGHLYDQAGAAAGSGGAARAGQPYGPGL